MTKKEKHEEEVKDQAVESPEKEMNENAASAKDEQSETSEVKGEIDELKEKYNDINDKYLRLYSEFDNFRKRTNKERLELYKTAGEDIFAALLPILDDFSRAQKAVEEKEDFESYKEGMKLIHQKLMNTLQNKGLKPIESAIGKDFDVNFHEAITKIPAPEKKLKGKVIDEVEKGYMLNEKVIRYTKVVIGE